MKDNKVQKRQSRKRRVRFKIYGTTECPRISVFSSNKHIFVQIIDDTTGKTLVSASDYEKGAKKIVGTKTEVARQIGMTLGQRAKMKNIKKAVFDRGGKLYHGRVQAVAESVRESGLEF